MCTCGNPLRHWPWGSGERHPSRRDGVCPHYWVRSAPAPAPVLAPASLPPAGTHQGKQTPSFPRRLVPLHQPGSKWDLATVAATSATEEETECSLRIGYGLQMKSDMQTAKNVGYVRYPAPHLYPICTKDSCHFPGLKQNPGSASPTTLEG